MSWFDIKQVFDGVTAFMEPGHYEEAISYLVVGTERAALLDTGMAIGDLASEVRKITRLPITVANTHAHWDHRGENYKFDDIAIYESEAHDLEAMHGADKLAVKTRPVLFTRPTPPGFWPSQWQVFPSKATRLLHPHDDGHTVPARAPNGRLDYIFVNDELRDAVRTCEVVTVPSAVRAASDHLPVMMDFCFDGVAKMG